MCGLRDATKHGQVRNPVAVKIQDHEIVSWTPCERDTIATESASAVTKVRRDRAEAWVTVSRDEIQIPVPVDVGEVAFSDTYETRPREVLVPRAREESARDERPARVDRVSESQDDIHAAVVVHVAEDRRQALQGK